MIDHANGGMKRMNREVRIVVEVAEYNNGEAIELGRPAPQRQVLANNARMIGLNEGGVDAGRGNRGSGC